MRTSAVNLHGSGNCLLTKYTISVMYNGYAMVFLNCFLKYLGSISYYIEDRCQLFTQYSYSVFLYLNTFTQFLNDVLRQHLTLKSCVSDINSVDKITVTNMENVIRILIPSTEKDVQGKLHIYSRFREIWPIYKTIITL